MKLCLLFGKVRKGRSRQTRIGSKKGGKERIAIVRKKGAAVRYADLAFRYLILYNCINDIRNKRRLHSE